MSDKVSGRVETDPKPKRDMGRIIRSFAAQAIGAPGTVPPLQLVFDAEVPAFADDDAGSCGGLRDAQRFYRAEGEKIAAAMLGSLPGGLVDGLLGALLEEKASIYRVAHHDGRSAPVDPLRPTCGESWPTELRRARRSAAKLERRDVVAFLQDRAASYGNPGGPIDEAFRSAAQAIGAGYHTRGREGNGEDALERSRELGAIREAEDRGAILESKVGSEFISGLPAKWIQIEHLLAMLRAGAHRPECAAPKKEGESRSESVPPAPHAGVVLSDRVFEIKDLKLDFRPAFRMNIDRFEPGTAKAETGGSSTDVPELDHLSVESAGAIRFLLLEAAREERQDVRTAILGIAAKILDGAHVPEGGR